MSDSATPWTAARKTSLFFIISQICSNSCALSQWCHPKISSSIAPFFSCPQSFLASWSFPMSHLFTAGGQNIGASASASVPSNDYSGLISFRTDWFDLLASKGLSRVFSNINSSILRLFYFTDFTSIHDYWKNHGLIIQIFAGKVMSLLFNLLSRFVIVFCPRSKCLLISSEKAQWKSWLKTQHSKN